MQKLLDDVHTTPHIAVLMGGVSDERNVSLKSGKAVAHALKTKGFRVSLIDLKERCIEPVEALNPDAAFIALHGEFGEDGQVQELLEDAGIPYTGSGPLASRIGMDKVISKRAYLKSGVPTPSYSVCYRDVEPNRIIAQAEAFGFPIVTKPTIGGSSIDVTISQSKKELSQAIDKWLSDQSKYSAAPDNNGLMIEKYIAGRELTVGVIDDTALPVVEIVSPGSFFDYQAKYEADDTEYILPVSLIESVYNKVCETALRAYKATGCRHMGRVDLIYGYDGEVYVLELNTIPGMTSRSLLPMAADYNGIDFASLCVRLCFMALGTKTESLSDLQLKRRTA